MRHARADQDPARQFGIEGGVEQGKDVQPEAHQQHQQGQQRLERPFAAQGQHAADQHIDAKDGRDDLEHRQGWNGARKVRLRDGRQGDRPGNAGSRMGEGGASPGDAPPGGF